MPSLFSLLPFASNRRTKFIVTNPNDPSSAREVIVFDASPKKTHKTTVTLTEFPVEDGSKPSDHADVGPRELELEVVMSATPITLLGTLIGNAAGVVGGAVGGKAGAAVTGGISVLGGFISNGGNRVRDSYSIMLELQGYKNINEKGLPQRSSPVPVDVITSLTTYKNMIITNVTAPQEASMGDSVRFTVSLKEIKTVQSKTVRLPKSVLDAAVKHSATGEVDRGKQEAKDSSLLDQLRGKSILKIGAGAIFGQG